MIARGNHAGRPRAVGRVEAFGRLALGEQLGQLVATVPGAQLGQVVPTEATRKRTSMTRDEHSAQQARFETIAAEKSAMIEGSLKATPCNRFMKNGACKAGANCRFLHGKLELVKSISLLLLEVEDHG